MRGRFRNAWAMVAMLWSGAAAVIAGPVSIRTTLESFRPLVLLEPKWETPGRLDRLMALASQMGDSPASWFPQRPGLAAEALFEPGPVARPVAAVIPLPSSVWGGAAGLAGLATALAWLRRSTASSH